MKGAAERARIAYETDLAATLQGAYWNRAKRLPRKVPQVRRPRGKRQTAEEMLTILKGGLGG